MSLVNNRFWLEKKLLKYKNILASVRETGCLPGIYLYELCINVLNLNFNKFMKIYFYNLMAKNNFNKWNVSM